MTEYLLSNFKMSRRFFAAGIAFILLFLLGACSSTPTQIVSEKPVPKKICFNFKPGFGVYIGSQVRKDASDQEVSIEGKHFFTGALPIIATSNIISFGEDPAHASGGRANQQAVYIFKLMEPARAELSGATFKRRGDYLIVKNQEKVYSASLIQSQIDQDSFSWSPQVAGGRVFDEICQR